MKKLEAKNAYFRFTKSGKTALNRSPMARLPATDCII